MGYLILSRKMGETLSIGDSVIVINRIKGSRVTLGIDAPIDVKVMRGELPPDAPIQREEAECKESKQC
jgi:carbon storage regulator